MAQNGSLPSHIVPLRELDRAWAEPSAGARLEAVLAAAPRLRERVLESGRVLGVRTCDLMTFPYPTRFGLGGAARSLSSYLFMTNRMQVVQLETLAGERKLLLFNPTDIVRSADTPYFRALRRRFFGPFETRLTKHALARGTQPHEHLAALGFTSADVDYIAFDHMHTQDVRAWLGTPELAAIFPRARLLIWQPELALLANLHPLQRKWYLPDAVLGVAQDRILTLDGDCLLGKGVALVRTPGHTAGNWSLVLCTERGVWAVSENGISCDSYAPAHSRVRRLRKHARREQVEVILNANSLEGRNEQYTSMLLERALVDRCSDAPEFYQHFASSEWTPSPAAPLLAPTYRHRRLEAGHLVCTGSAAHARTTPGERPPLGPSAAP
jgi:hypothetical protein